MDNRRPRICFLVGGREGGGAALAIDMMISRIDRSRYDIRLAACEDTPLSRRLAELCPHAEVLGTGWPPHVSRNVLEGRRSRLSGYLAMPLWILRTTGALARMLRRHDIDLIHTNYRTFHLIAGLASLCTGCRCVWYWHGVIDNRAGESLCRMVRGMIPQRIWSLANSKTTLESIRGIAGERASVNYLGIDLSEINAAKGRLRELAGLTAGSRLVGLVATLNPLKGHAFFIRTAAEVRRRFDDVHFLYIGGHTAAGQQDYLESLHRLREELGLRERVHFLGHQPGAAALMADLDVATVCTLPPGEGFGLVIVEAMAQSIPVVATNVGAATELIEDRSTGLLVPPADPTAMAEAICKLLENEGLRRSLGEAGRRSCAERFDLNRTVRGIEAIYDRLLDRS